MPINLDRPASSVRRLRRVPAVILMLAALVVAGAPAGPVRASGGDAVITWNAYAVEALTSPATAATPGAGQTPPVAALHMAMVQLAVYDAVNAIEGGHEAYLSDLPAASPGASVDAAIATAAHRVLTGLVPALSVVVRDRLDALYEAALGQIVDGGSKTQGIAIGAATAQGILADRIGDGRYGPGSFTAGTEPGAWRPSAPAFISDPFAWVAGVRPFVLESSAQYQTEGPVDMKSLQYATEFAEVQSLGSSSSTTRTTAQTALALFYTESAVTLFNRTFRLIAAEQSLGSSASARLFASLAVASADSVITCWADKKHWSFWRPITAIRLADTDGNRRTAPDPAWTPLVATPPYPDHSSGFNCFSAAIAHSAKAFFGTDVMSFSVRNAAGVNREYARFSDIVRDTIDARVYLGLHFRNADVQGAWIGKKVAQWVAGHEFAPTD